MSSTTETQSGRATKVVVATSVMLSFISFWRAAAIVLNDLGSSAFYVGGIAEQAVGQAAPWFILGIMLFSYAVRSVYIESCAMFTRGGVYRVVKEAMGDPGKAFGFRSDVRLYIDRTDLRRIRGPIHCGARGSDNHLLRSSVAAVERHH